MARTGKSTQATKGTSTRKTIAAEFLEPKNYRITDKIPETEPYTKAVKNNPIIRTMLSPYYSASKPNKSVNEEINRMVKDGTLTKGHIVKDLGQRIKKQTVNIGKALKFLSNYSIMCMKLYQSMAKIHKDYYGAIDYNNRRYLLTGKDLSDMKEVLGLLTRRLQDIISAVEKRDPTIETKNSLELKGSHTIVLLSEPLQTYILAALQSLETGQITSNVTYTTTINRVTQKQKDTITYSIYDVLPQDKVNEWLNALRNVITEGYISKGLLQSVLHLAYDSLGDLTNKSSVYLTDDLLESLSEEFNDLLQSDIIDGSGKDKLSAQPFSNILQGKKIIRLSFNASLVSHFTTPIVRIAKDMFVDQHNSQYHLDVIEDNIELAIENKMIPMTDEQKVIVEKGQIPKFTQDQLSQISEDNYFILLGNSIIADKKQDIINLNKLNKSYKKAKDFFVNEKAKAGSKLLRAQFPVNAKKKNSKANDKSVAYITNRFQKPKQTSGRRKTSYASGKINAI